MVSQTITVRNVNISFSKMVSTIVQSGVNIVSGVQSILDAICGNENSITIEILTVLFLVSIIVYLTIVLFHAIYDDWKNNGFHKK